MGYLILAFDLYIYWRLEICGCMYVVIFIYVMVILGKMLVGCRESEVSIQVSFVILFFVME